MRIGVVGDLQTVVGFRLAGVRTVHEIVVGDEGTDWRDVTQGLIDAGVVLIIATEATAGRLRPHLPRTIMVIEIPDATGPRPREESIAQELARQATGVSIKE